MTFNTKTLYYLLRFKPVMAWSISGVLLALSAAVCDYGFDLNWLYLFEIFLCACFIQYMAHPLNDLFDEEVDKIADIEGTGRTKVLVSGMATRRDLWSTVLFVSFIVVLLVMHLIEEFGYDIALYIFIGVYALIAYNAPPLKLGWRPFAEWTVVFPTLTAVVMVTYYIATGHITTFIIWLGVIHALFNVCWFVHSRAIDCEADSKFGKRTTIVKFGIENYLDIALIYNTLLFFVCIVATIYIDFVFMLSVCISLWSLITVTPTSYELNKRIISRYKPTLTKYELHTYMISRYRNVGIYTTILHALLLSALVMYNQTGRFI